MTQRLQLTTQVEMVVQLSIEHHPYTAVFVGHRLGAALEVHDAETAVPEGR